MLVSCVIPCYNASATIKRSVDSIIDQTIDIHEILIIDDGSDQRTKTVLNDIESNYKKVKVFAQTNQGVSNARNRGISLAQNDLLLLLDADDTFEPSFAEKAVIHFKSSGTIGAVLSGYNLLKYNNVIDRTFPSNAKIENFLIKNSAVASGLFSKSVIEIIGGYDDNMSLGYEDWEMNIRLVAAGYQFHVIQEYLFNYTVNPISRNSIAKNNDIDLRMYIYNKHKDLYVKHLDAVYGDLIRNIDAFKNQINNEERMIEVRLGKRFRRLVRRFFR